MNGVVLPYAGDSGTRSFTRYDIRTFRTVYMLLRVGGVVDIIIILDIIGIGFEWNLLVIE